MCGRDASVPPQVRLRESVVSARAAARRYQVNSNIKTGIFWVILACVLVLLWQVVKAAKTKPDKQLTFTEFLSDVEAGKVKRVSISSGMDVKGSYKDNSADLHTLIPANYPDIYKILQEKGVEI